MASNDPDECEAGLLGAEDASEEASAPVALCRRGSAALGLLVLLALLAMGGHRSLRLHPHLEANVEDFVREFSMPEGAGVNLGGWFVLEDWFFSGSSGKLVSSEHREGQGRCLPPLLHHVNEPWPSEGVLAFRLNASMGTKQTTRIFQAHREEFFQKEELQEIVRSGIDTIRLPLTWAAFADALETALVPDPFYPDIAAFATIPRAELASFLRHAARNGATVILDIHAFPGGSQQGTYNGIWPNRPAFWTENSKVGNPVPLTEVGRWIVQALIQWAETLDPEAKKGIKGLTLMNEPAHFNAWTHFAQEDDVLSWLSEAADDFRKSMLPVQGVKLYVNMIETAFSQFERSAVPWFLKTFSQEEREQWAIADVHWYVAWDSGHCDGRTVKGGAFSCSAPLADVRGKLNWCAHDASSRLRHLFGKGLVAVTEFSAGTFHQARYACSDSKVVRAFLEEQVKAFRSDQIEPFFWTWKMPFGPNFEPGWSLKYLLGLEKDHERALGCGEPASCSAVVIDQLNAGLCRKAWLGECNVPLTGTYRPLKAAWSKAVCRLERGSSETGHEVELRGHLPVLWTGGCADLNWAVGLSFAVLGNEVLLTDIGDLQATLTQGNITQNQGSIAAAGGAATYATLDWRRLPQRDQYGYFDLVFAGDVIWHETLVEPFLQAVAWATSGPGAGEVILSHKVRDQESVALFQQMLSSLGLQIAKEVPSEQLLGQDGHPDVRVYHLKRVH
ncbi:exgA [Symbiodinium pilosum]|uniref:ExgA protein n=1 Tax=Symbiodinium pilosum TaxID=2952 RepID=A0A812LWP1_SYMPI|nr:exgA [Symbiodinium pilosum]